MARVRRWEEQIICLFFMGSRTAGTVRYLTLFSPSFCLLYFFFFLSRFHLTRNIDGVRNSSTRAKQESSLQGGFRSLSVVVAGVLVFIIFVVLLRLLIAFNHSSFILVGVIY